jgi:D-inositol-3-phosphate glycosyltransferase
VRILFVSPYALPHLGGVEVAIDAVAEELQQRGHEVVHIASDAVRAGEAPAPPPGYRVLRVPANNALEDRTGAPWPLFGRRLLRALEAELPRADVVHAHGFVYSSSVAALVRARALRANSPLRVLTEHVGHVLYDSPLLDRSEALAIGTLGRLSARSAEGLVYYNDQVGSALARFAPRGLLRRIPNGVDTRLFRPPEPDEKARLRAELGWDERPRALFVGRLVEKKGVHAALAAAAAGEGEFELVLAGPGELPGSAPAAAESLGSLPRERMAAVYRAADAFVLPSRGEGFPLAVQEAMASGLPVLLADDPAYRPHLAEAGPAAILLPPEGGAIAAALRELFGDPARLAEAGARAAELARTQFSWSAAADRHEELYAELAERRSSRPSRPSSRSSGARAGVP